MPTKAQLSTSILEQSSFDGLVASYKYLDGAVTTTIWIGELATSGLPYYRNKSNLVEVRASEAYSALPIIICPKDGGDCE